MGPGARIAIGLASLAALGGAAAYVAANGVDGDEPPPIDPPAPPPVDPPEPPPPTKPVVATDVARLSAELAARFTETTVPAHEWRVPDGPIRGVMLVVHGGGWYGVGPDTFRSMDGEVERWNARGWATLNVDYREGGNSIIDVQRAYDALRAWQGAEIPIAAIGASAGGHLSLLLGANRPDLSFVVSEAGPTDIPAIGGNGFADLVRESGLRAFGDTASTTHSPVVRARDMKMPVLAANASNDGIVPVDQLHRFAAAKPDARIVELAAGDRPWVHSGVADHSFAEFTQAEDELAEAAALPLP